MFETAWQVIRVVLRDLLDSPSLLPARLEPLVDEQ